MLDWVSVRVPHATPFSSEFGRDYRDLGDEQDGPFKQSKHYLKAADLRPFGYPVTLHLWNLHASGGFNHKLELRDVGRMGYREILHQVDRVFDVHPRKLELMRLDVAADVPGVPVSWFQGRTLVARKQFAAAMGVYTEMGKREIQTLYAGKRPNFFRIYDKVAERQQQYRKEVRWARAKDKEIPSFDEIFGYPEDCVLTRVERQMAARGIPSTLSKLGDLTNAPDFNPYEPLKIVSGTVAPTVESVGLEVFLQARGLEKLVAEWGLQQTRGFLSKHARSRNSGRLWKKLLPFLHSPEQETASITAGDLFDYYRESTFKQLAA